MAYLTKRLKSLTHSWALPVLEEASWHIYCSSKALAINAVHYLWFLAVDMGTCHYFYEVQVPRLSFSRVSYSPSEQKHRHNTRYLTSQYAKVPGGRSLAFPVSVQNRTSVVSFRFVVCSSAQLSRFSSSRVFYNMGCKH